MQGLWVPGPFVNFAILLQGVPEDPQPPTDDEENDAALPEPTEPQDEDVKTDEIEDNGEQS